MRVLLVFPPLTDASAPYLALPSLKASLEARLPRVRATCVDLNRDFVVEDVLGDGFEDALAAYRRDVTGESTEAAIVGAWRFHRFLAARSRAWEERWPGHRLTLGNFGRYEPPDESGDHARDPAAVADYAAGETPFDDRFRRTLARFEEPPALVGATLMIAYQLLPLARFSSIVREVWPDTRIVWGGAQLTRIVDAAMDPALAPLYDFLVTREGEDPFVEIAREVAGGAPATSHKIVRSGTAPRDRHDVRALPAEELTDLGTLPPPDFSDLPVGAYLNAVPTLPLMISRKCYWGRCAFCDIHTTWDPGHRERPVDAVLAELRRAAEVHGVRHFYMNDEAVPPKLLRAVCERILAEGLDVRFMCTGILEKRFLDPSLVDLFARAGGRLMQWGLEACDAETLAAMNKRINRVRHYDELMGRFAAAGVHNLVYSVAGYPFGAPDTDRTTAAFVRGERSIHSALILAFGVERDAPLGRTLEDAERAGTADERAETLAVYRRMGIPEPIRRLYLDLFTERLDLTFLAELGQEDRFALTVFHGPDCAQRVDLDALVGADEILAVAGAPDSPHGPLLERIEPEAEPVSESESAPVSVSESESGAEPAPEPAPEPSAAPAPPPAAPPRPDPALASHAALVRRVAERLGDAARSPLRGWRLVDFAERRDDDGYAIVLRLRRGDEELGLDVLPGDAPGPACATAERVKLRHAPDTLPSGDLMAKGLPRLARLLDHYLATVES